MKGGDFFVSTSKGAIGSLIGLGQRIHVGKEGSQWHHAGFIMNPQGDTLEALAHGITKGNIRDHSKIQVFDTKFSDIQRAYAMIFAQSCLGDPYGYIDIGSIAVDILTPNKIVFRTEGTLICSEFVTLCLEHGGWVCPKLDASHVMPSELYRWWK